MDNGQWISIYYTRQFARYQWSQNPRTMKRLEFDSPEDELKFYRKLHENIPAIIEVNQVEYVDNSSSAFNLWSNKRLFDFVGYTEAEIVESGYNFFQKIIHPDDMVTFKSYFEEFNPESTASLGGIVRVKPKNGDYHWFVGRMSVMEMKDGKPWRIAIIMQNLGEMQDTKDQFFQLLKENYQLKNMLRFQKLTNREKEIIKLITNGNTDKEIAEELIISPATVKTHRHNIIRKLELKNKASIAQFATENGLN